MARGVSAPSCRCAWPRDVHDAAGTENGPHSTHALLGHAVKRAPRLATRAIQKTPPSRNTYPALNSTNTSRLGSSEPDRIPATNMAAAATVLTAQTKRVAGRAAWCPRRHASSDAVVAAVRMPMALLFARSPVAAALVTSHTMTAVPRRPIPPITPTHIEYPFHSHRSCAVMHSTFRVTVTF